MSYSSLHRLRNWIAWLLIGALCWLLLGVVVTRANDVVYSTWTGFTANPSLTVSARCLNTGSEYVWAAETGTQLLDIIQIGSVGSQFFYAYGNGTPGATGSSYVEHEFGYNDGNYHTYGISFVRPYWYLSIDGTVQATISDSFRGWTLQHTKVMAEGNLPFGWARCYSTNENQFFGGYGPQPSYSFGTGWWAVW